MTRFRISEIYASLQGEGILTGTPSLFVRTSGCNLRCWFCDTPFASWEPEGRYLSIDDILSRCCALESDQNRCQFPVERPHVVLTGGEPMIYAQLPELCRALKNDTAESSGHHWVNRHLTIETAGTVFQPVPCDLMSISPKLSGSAPGFSTSKAARGGPINPSWQATHHQRRERLDVVRQLMQRYAYQLKFVVDCLADAHEVLEYLDRLGDFAGERILLMPQGTDRETLARQADWLLPWCQKHELRFCSRAHIEWFGNRRGT